MHCPMQSRENSDLLLAYVERKLDPEMASTFERHTEDCPACQEALAAQRMVWEALDRWDAAEISPDFNRRLYRRVEAEGSRAWWRRLWEPAMPWGVRPAMPAAAACMVLVAAMLFQAPAGGDLPRKAESTMDVEQVERTLDDLEMLKQLGVAPADSPGATTL